MDLTGQKIDKYELIESLGQGGMAEVYKAYQPGLDRFVAIKLMHRHLASSTDFIDRFKREARSIGQLQHPHIMQVIDFDVADSTYYLVMGYIQGETLNDFLEKHGAIAIDSALSIAIQLADAVDYAHGFGMIHRDIKPANIMFRDDTLSHAILTDFGMARLVDQAKLTMSGTLVGTPAYMSPEASRSEPVDERGDVYSLGVVLYEMLTGTTPYTGDTAVAIIVKQATQPLPPPREIAPGIPEPVEYVLMKALEKDPADRFQSAADFRDALERVQVAARGDIPTLIEPLDQFDDDDDDATILTVQRPVKAQAPPQPPSIAQTPPAPATALPSAMRWILPVGIGVIIVAVLFLVALSFLLGNRQQDPVTGEVAPGENGQNEGAVAVSLDGPQPSGFLRFADNETSRAGDFSIQLSGVAPPPAGSHYELWLTDEAGTEVLSLIGKLTVTNGQVDQQGSTDQNLIGRFSQTIVSLETDGDSDGQISDQIVFQGSLPANYVDNLRQVMVSNPDNQKGYLLGAFEQLETAENHTGFLEASLAGDDLGGARRHAEHVVNILEGKEGEHYGDLDGNGLDENPGDGFGARTYLIRAIEAAQRTTEAATVSATTLILDEQIKNNGDTTLTTLDKAIEKTLQIFAADTVEEAVGFRDELRRLLEQVRNGTDLDNNGAIDPTKNEGGLVHLYQDSLHLGEIPIFPVE